MAGFEDVSRGRNWDLGRKTLSYINPPSLLRTRPSPVGYLGQVPLNRGVFGIVEVGLPMLVLQLHPLWGEGRSGLPVASREEKKRFPLTGAQHRPKESGGTGAGDAVPWAGLEPEQEPKFSV